MKRRKRISRRAQAPTVWQALNEPIAYPSREFSNSFFSLALFILLMVWVTPYWGVVSSQHSVVSRVAGETLPSTDYGLPTTVPNWYETAQQASSDVAMAFGNAANEVLDVSEPVGQVVEFYEPGVEAVWDAWIELMMDPY